MFKSSRESFLITLVIEKIDYQATKGARWMPWGKGPMKDAVSGDTPGGAAIKL
jgi:hypothetical protein